MQWWWIGGRLEASWPDGLERGTRGCPAVWPQSVGARWGRPQGFPRRTFRHRRLRLSAVRSSNSSPNIKVLQNFTNWVPGHRNLLLDFSISFDWNLVLAPLLYVKAAKQLWYTCIISQVNKEFSAALGHRAYTKLVTLVQGDSSIRKVEGARGSPRLMTRFSEDQQEELVLEGAVVKEELVDDDIPYMEDNYLEPTVCLTEPEEVSGGLASVDPSTVTTNTPTLALATVPPDTPILGGRVTPHPTDRMIAVHPSQFIRCT